MATRGNDLDVEALMKQMLSRLSDADFLIQACSWLVEHARKVPEVPSARMNTTLILTTVMQVMKAHPGRDDLQANIICVISECTRESRPNCDLFLGEGGIDMLITAITEHQGSLALQHNAFNLIQDLEEQIVLRRETKRALSRTVVVSMNNLMQPSQGERVRHALCFDTSRVSWTYHARVKRWNQGEAMESG